MSKFVQLPESYFQGQKSFGFFEDFLDLGTIFAANDSGDYASVSTSDGLGGVVELYTAPALNNEAYIVTNKASFKFVSGHPILCEGRVLLTDSSTEGTQANLCFGLMDSVGTGTLQNSGGGLPASYSGAMFYKVTNDNYWWCETGDGSTKVVRKSAAQINASNYQLLKIEAVPLLQSQLEVKFSIDGVIVSKIYTTYTNAGLLNVVVGVKAGESSSESLLVDYVACYQSR